MLMSPARPPTRRRVGIALMGLALLSLLAADPSDNAYDDDDADDVAYYSDRRVLRAGRSRKPVINPHACGVRPQTSCNGVLITSQGGVGSSRFISAVEKHVARGAATFCTNDDRDMDGFKHSPSGAYEHNSTSLARNGVCFSKVLVILGDPLHTVESTYRRFRMSHINKLRTRNGRGFFRGKGLDDLYRDMAAAGEDITGITDYVTSWQRASTDDTFPEIRLVTAKTLFENAADHARWIGVEGPGMRTFGELSFDPTKQHATVMTAGSADVQEKVRGVFGTVEEIVRQVEEEPTMEGTEPQEKGGAEEAGGGAEVSTS